uniref:Adenylate cyclase type v-like protein n=1 Tax=Gillichthys mirabilis TaxID=8222 RepID=Q9DFJ2_GILMI|nr:adenylate cyclase type v-like protein [Gillichthys mirabilis]
MATGEILKTPQACVQWPSTNISGAHPGHAEVCHGLHLSTSTHVCYCTLQQLTHALYIYVIFYSCFLIFIMVITVSCLFSCCL